MSGGRVRVLYDFTAETTDELSVRAGQELEVIDSTSYDGWMQVKNPYGGRGIVPYSYVEMIESADDADIPPPPSSDPYSPPPTSYYKPPTAAAASYTSSWDAPSIYKVPASTTPATSSSANNSYMNVDNSSFGWGSTPAAPVAAAAATGGSSAQDDPWDLDFFDSTPKAANPPPAAASAAPASPQSSTDFFSFDNPPPASVPGAASPSSPPPAATASPSAGNVNPSFQAGRSNRGHDDDSSFSEDETPNHSANAGAGGTLGAGRNSSNMSASTLNLPGGRHKAKNSYGLDTFLLYGAVKAVPDFEKQSVIIMTTPGHPIWKQQDPPYSVEIVGYTADRKYHGVKKFTSYEIQTKTFNARVKRRYNHFDWLLKRLTEKYPNICIPPLPDKAVTGNFEDEFINKRKAQLELWLNRMSSHPVIGRSEVFVHFLQCDDASAKWKQGKRKAEKDEYRGAQWFCTLTVPGTSIDTPTNLKDKAEKFSKAAKNMDSCVSNMCSALDKIVYFHTSAYKKELAYFGKKLEELGTTISAEPLDAPNNAALSTALVTAGNTYTQIANHYGEQAKLDVHPLLDRLSLYRGIIQQMPDIVQFEKNAVQTYEEVQQRPDKFDNRNPMEVASRLEIVSHVTFAEINLFNRDKVDDINRYMRSFLQQQIAFYTEITDCLKQAYAKFEQVPLTTTSPHTSGSQLRR